MTNKYKSSYKFSSKNSGKDSVCILPLGGVGGVTKNMYVYEYRIDDKLSDILLVDCGIGFPDPDMYGVDLVIPDISYLKDKKQYIRGLVFTHGHDDHIGGIPYVIKDLGNIKMWGTKLTAAFTNAKLKEAGIGQKVLTVDFDAIIKLRNFNISFVRMTHSIPDTANIVIDTPLGKFYHGSDFKFDFSPLDNKLPQLSKINEIGKRGVLCLLTDSLGADRRGFTQSERIVGETLEKELKLCSGKFIFTTVSSNISRIQLAVDLADKYKRHISFMGRSIKQNIKIAQKLGYMSVLPGIEVYDNKLKKISDRMQFLLVAGSQGQPESALSKIANDENRNIKLKENDTVVISADVIPGNEFHVNKLIEQLYRKKVRVSYLDIMEDLHVSGHGSQGDLMLLLSSLNPKYVMPMGGTYKHLIQYKRLASDIGFNGRNVIIPDSGDVIKFTRYDKPKISENIYLNDIYVDGLGIGDVGSVVLRDRQTIAKEGIVVIIVSYDSTTCKIVKEPDIVSRGFVYMKESRSLLDKTRRKVLEALRVKKSRAKDYRYLKRRIEETVFAFIKKEIGREPLIVPVILEV